MSGFGVFCWECFWKTETLVGMYVLKSIVYPPALSLGHLRDSDGLVGSQLPFTFPHHRHYFLYGNVTIES